MWYNARENSNLVTFLLSMTLLVELTYSGYLTSHAHAHDSGKWQIRHVVMCASHWKAKELLLFCGLMSCRASLQCYLLDELAEYFSLEAIW